MIIQVLGLTVFGIIVIIVVALLLRELFRNDYYSTLDLVREEWGPENVSVTELKNIDGVYVSPKEQGQ